MKNENIAKELASMFADKNRNDDIEIAIEAGFGVIVDEMTAEVYFEKKYDKPNRKERRGRKYRQRMADIKKHRLGQMRQPGVARGVEITNAYFVVEDEDGKKVKVDVDSLSWDEIDSLDWSKVKATKTRDSGYKSYENGDTAWSRKVRHSDKKECFDFLCEKAVDVETVGRVTVAEDDGFGFDEGFINGEFIGYTTCTDWRVGMPMKVRNVVSSAFFEGFQEYQNKKWHELISEYADAMKQMKALESQIADEFGVYRVSEAMLTIAEEM